MLSITNINDHQHTYYGKLTDIYGNEIHINLYRKELRPPTIEYIVRIFCYDDIYERKFIETNNKFESKLENTIEQGKFLISGAISPINAIYLYDVENTELLFNISPILFICNIQEEKQKCIDYLDSMQNKLTGK